MATHSLIFCEKRASTVAADARYAIKRAQLYLILMHVQKPIHVSAYRQLGYELFVS